MRVYVIRHGESETNLSKKWTGQLDVHLTENGVKQAEKVGQFLKSICFDKVFSSDLSRAVETMEAALSPKDYEKSSLLREINVGTLVTRDLSVLTGEQRAYVLKEGFMDFGGESQRDLYNRIRTFQKELEKLDAENVAVFTHAGWVRGMLDTVVGTYVPRNNIACENCTVAIFEYNGNWRLHSWITLS